MNSRKQGKLFAVLMFALLAYGLGSCISLLTADIITLEVPEVLAADQQQISTIGNPSFEPVWIKRHIIQNITNNTTTNDTNNNDNPPIHNNSSDTNETTYFED
ncbi:hypothetical protein [Methanobacterium alcaliphilum]|uniref:hypothetical protein n=1 Tax=Methanobacterium alcaliphilum TaxID=392018 RepID=UPI00200B0E41|nr:hypothetical protein [Methanobacterium alcaliphilum]MCK9152036.1 hypothetical protein [Methanobacterium alcaliphilum]